MSEILQPLGQWDTALDKEGCLWASVDGEGWRCTGLYPESSTWTPRCVADHNLMRTPLGAELESLREEVVRLRFEAALQGSVAKREARTEYVTRDELTEKLDEVYQAFRDAAPYSGPYAAAPERPMPERPPIPPEPTGLGAIVRDTDGCHWTRVRGGRWRARVLGGAKRDWDEVTKYGPLTVEFEGVES